VWIGNRCTATARDAGRVTVARKEIPEAWIGEQVALRYWRGDGRATVDCKLEAVSKRGVAVTIEVEEESWTRFYPWSAVLHIQLGGDEDPLGR
jgi:hypothetical protein